MICLSAAALTQVDCVDGDRRVARPSMTNISAPQSGVCAPARVDLNRATVEELMKLPGIGATLAARIVEHRRLHGPFRRPQDVIIIRGMSARRYRQIAHLICSS
jgi:competence ComEA-like helix-hairpin-helix protein